MSKSLLKSTSLVSSMTMISRVLGFVRDMIIAQVFGAVAGADAFFVAFKIPNFMRRLFAEGAFAQAVVPVLSDYKTQEDQQQMRRLVSALAGSLALVLLAITIIAVLLSPWLIRIFAPGFPSSGERFLLASHMLRLTFPYLFFISLTALVAAILNTYDCFGPPAFTPVFLNVALISAALWLAPHLQHPVYALAWGVLIAGVVQLSFLMPFLSRFKVWVWPRINFKQAGVKRVLTLMGPAIFGVSIAQINLLFDTIFASFLPVGSVSWLYYSQRLMYFPLGVFGVAIATVILPKLSKQHATKSEAEFSKTLDWALRCILIIGVPAAVGLIMLAGPLLATLFHYGAFDNRDVLMSAKSLIAFSIGLPSFMLIKALVTGFYSREEMKFPVKVGAYAMITNIILNAALFIPLAHTGLALATTIAGFLNAGLLYWGLRRQAIFQPSNGWLIFLIRLVLANVIMAVIIFLLSPQISFWLQASWQWRVGHLAMILLAAMVSYFICLWRIKVN